MRKLALFDVDGTLVESNEFDTECFLEAVAQVLAIDGVDDDWSHYQHATDAGVLAEIYRSHRHGEISAAVVARVKERFLRIIDERLLRAGAQLRPLPGARKAVAALKGSSEWAIAVAGGGWRASIEKKLEKAAVAEMDGVPIFSSDDAVSRVEIMQKAIDTMLAETGSARFGRVVYVGDAIWDLRASRDLGLPFLAVGACAEELASLGASHSIRDFSSTEAFIDALERCRAPTLAV